MVTLLLNSIQVSYAQEALFSMDLFELESMETIFHPSTELKHHAMLNYG